MSDTVSDPETTIKNLVTFQVETDKTIIALKKQVEAYEKKLSEFFGIMKAISVGVESLNISLMAANQFGRDRLEFDRQDFEFRKTVSAQIREERQNGKTASASPFNRVAPEGVIDPTLLKWTLFPKGSGEWAFTTEKDGSPAAKAQPLIDAIKRGNGKLTMDGFNYSLSRDGKFLNRKAAGTR